MDDLRRRVRAVITSVRDWHVGLVLGASTVAIHFLVASAGTEVTPGDLSVGALVRYRQLLPVRLLRHHLIDNLSHLHTQPPLFNLVSGLLLGLSSTTAADIVNAVSAGLCGVLVVTSYLLVRELGVAKVVAFVAVVLFVLGNPALWIYGAQYSVILPTATLVTAMGWLAARWLRTERLFSGFVYGLLGLVLVLLNPVFQIYWLVAVSIPLAFAMRRYWHQVVLSLVIPVVVLTVFYVNALVQFNTVVTTTWPGMTLASTTTATDTPSDLLALIHQGVLSPTSLTRAFSCLSSYGTLGQRSSNNVVALSIREKAACTTSPGGVARGPANFDNIQYLGVSTQYWNNDVAWIEHRPVAYLANLVEATHYWLLTPEDGSAGVTLSSNFLHYENFYGRYLQWQGGAPSVTKNADSALTNDIAIPGSSNVSWFVVVTTSLTLLVLPLILFARRRQLSRLERASGWWIWTTTAMMFVLSTSMTLGHNNEFQFESGALPLAASCAVVTWVLRRRDREDVRTGHSEREKTVPSATNEVMNEGGCPTTPDDLVHPDEISGAALIIE